MDVDYVALFESLFERHYDEIAGYLMRRNVDRSTAEEIAQVTFVEAYEKRATYDPEKGAARGWLFGIATNLMRRHFRSEARQLRAYGRAARREIRPDDPSDAACTRLDADTRAPDIALALATLSRGDYEVLTLFCWADLSYDEIASAVGIPKGTVRSRLHRARGQVGALLNASILEDDNGL